MNRCFQKIIEQLEQLSLTKKMEAASKFCEADYITNTAKQHYKHACDMQAYAYDKSIDVVNKIIAENADSPIPERLLNQLEEKETYMKTLLQEVCFKIRSEYGGEDVCGLCQYDGAYVGESGDWCNECPGFDSDDCFCLSESVEQKLSLTSIVREMSGNYHFHACNVGDTVYYPEKDINFIFPVKISQIIISDAGNGKHCTQYNGCFFDGNGDPEQEFEFDDDDFGKTVFLTRSEAAKQLTGVTEESGEDNSTASCYDTIKTLLYFATTKDGDCIYLDERPMNDVKKNQSRLYDLIDDVFALQFELKWEQLDDAHRPNDVGVYQAVVQFVQIAEDDYRFDVIHCTPVCVFYPKH